MLANIITNTCINLGVKIAVFCLAYFLSLFHTNCSSLDEHMKFKMFLLVL